jgi:signal peptidase II
VRNTGAAWGLFSGFSGGLILLSFLMLGLLLCFRRHFLSDTRLHRVAAGLMVGGIIGNLIDRMKLGFVIDYVDFFVGSAHFPAFNVADAAICCGVGIYLLTQAWRSDTAEASPAEPSSPVTPQP